MSKVTLNQDGSINIDFDNIKKITIDHLTDVVSHRILRSGELTIHELEFINDGKVYLSYTAAGKIVSCKITKMNTQTNLEEGIVVLKPAIV